MLIGNRSYKVRTHRTHGSGRWFVDAAQRPSENKHAWRLFSRKNLANLLILVTVGATVVSTPELGLSGTVIGQPTSSKAVRAAAIRDIPFQGLTPEARGRISAVVSKPTMYRRMPISVLNADPELFQFLIRQPEVVVNIWQLMGITKVSAKRVGPYTLNATDGIGTQSKVELIYGTPDTHLIFCEGDYEGPLFRKPLRGRCVLLLKTGKSKGDDGAWKVSNRLDVFLQVDHLGVGALTKTFHPLMGKSADINFLESMKFLERLSQTAEKNGKGMERLAYRLDQIDPKSRERFAKLSMQVYQRKRDRLTRLATGQRPM